VGRKAVSVLDKVRSIINMQKETESGNVKKCYLYWQPDSGHGSWHLPRSV